MKKLFTFLVLLFGVLSSLLAGTPVDMYLTGSFNSWKFESKYQFSKVADNSYEIDLGKSPLLLKTGMEFKILSSDYDTYDYGTTTVSDCGTSYTLVKDKSANCKVESFILFSKVTFSTLTNEMILHCANDGEYSKTATLYIGAPCYYDSEPIKFGAFATEADFNNGKGAPYAIVKAQKVPSMYIHGYQVYKAEIPFDERVYVASMSYGSFNTVCKEFTEEGTWYCGSPYPGIGGCYRSFDEARFNIDLIDLNFKPEANTLYVIGNNPELTVYSSEYGIEQGKEISYEGKLGYTLKGKNIYYYPVTNVDIFDMVRYYGEDMAIDWNKPFFYEGECYASLKDVPVDELKETSCWKLWGFNAIDYSYGMVLYHVGNNVYKGTYEYRTIVPTDEALDITLANHASNTSGACVRQIKAIATPEQTGGYDITFTYDANTQDLTHEWELVSADAINVESSDIKGYFNGSSYLKSLDAKMELVGVNEYKYTCKAEMEKGLKYYTIKDSYSNFTAKDILFQIPETWLYEFTFTYNAATQKYACDVKKSYDFDPIYFRGTVNEWGVDEKYKLTTTDGDYYVATYAAGKEVELGDPEGGTAKFKIGSGNDNWRPINFGYSKSQYKYLTAGTPCILASGGSDVSIVGSLKASKIEFTKSTGTLLVTAAQTESEYTTVYVVNENRLYNIYAFARPINSTDYDDVEVEKLPKTYQGYEVYSYTFKSIYDQLMINGTGGNSISYFTVNKVKPYYYGGVWYETLDMEDAKPTYIYLVNTSGMDLEKITKYYSNLDRTGQVKQPVLISEKVAGYDVYRFEVDAVATGIVWYTPDYSPEIGYPFDVDESEKLTPYYANGVWYESLADIKIDPKPEGPTVFDTTTDQGVAFVVNPNSANPVFVPLTHNSYNLEFQTAQYTGTYTVTDLDFTAKIGGLTNLDVINFGTNGQALEANYLYNPTRGASNGFTITGDYKVGDILNINATFDSDWNVTLIIDVTKTLEPTPNDITLYYVNSNKWAAVNGYVWPTGGAGILEWPGAPATKIDKTVDGFDVYSYTFDSTKADNIIFNAGSGGAQTKDLAVNAAKPYYYGGVWYETLTFDAAGGDEGGEEGGDTGSEGGEEGGDDTGDVEIGEPANLYIIGALTGWAADATWQFSTADDEYFVLSFPKGQEQELSGQFKVASSNWSPYNYGAPLDLGSVEAGKEYVLEYNVATNLSIANIIKVSKIEFTLSTQTLKITGATEEKVFDTTSDYGFYLYADYKDYPFTFKGNGVYEYDYTGVGPSSTIGDYQYKTVEWGRNSTGNTVTLGELYQLGLSNHPISFPDATTGQTLTIVLTVSSDWSATILVKDKSSEEGGEEGGDDTDPIVPETAAYVVRGNGGSDATGIWCGGIEWTADDSPVNNMTDADKDGIYEVTYKNVPAGTWNFKVVGATEGWMGSDYLDTENSSAGYTTAPYDGNIGFTLNAPADVTIQFNTLTGKIIATTPSGSFGKVVIEHFHILTGNNQCLDELEFTEANNYTLVLTQEVVIDEEYGVAYVGCGILGNCDYAVYEKYFSIEVTENGTYTVTVQFNGDYENPDFTVTAVKQGGSNEPIVPDPVISDITAPTFPQTEVGKASTATVTYTLENATSATVSIESEGEEAFFIQSQSVVKGKGSVSIMFMPETQGVHAATLVIKSGKVTETLRILAKAVDPAPEVLPVISDIDVPAFADTYLNATNVVTATYSLANATEATATISGANADAFYILSQSVGSVKILFMPEAEGTYNAILTITSGKTSESVNFTAKAIEFIPEPEPAISNVNVPAFATIEIGSAANVTATFTLENATEVSATLSGAGADAFILGQPMVNNGNGSIKIAFVPTEAGTYTATLTLKSGKAVHTATITAVATEPAPQVRIENIQVPVFEEVYLGGYASVNVTYTLVNATKATVTVTGDVFTTGNNSVVGGIGTVPVDFMPETAGVHTATLTITAGGVSESVTLVAIAKLNSTDEPSGKVTISNLQVPEFASITAKEITTVTASYVVTGSTVATATLSGTDAAYFTILSQTLSEGVGQVEIAFAPTVAREYNATMVVTSGGVTESINFAATASEAPSILGLHVNDFGTVYVGEKVTVMANYSLAYAETATATLSGDTDVFAISRQMVSDGNGLVRIDFTPIAAGTYHATLTIKSGVSEESIDFSATAIKYEEPVIEPVISNLMVPEFGEVLIGETVQKIATYTLENATEATATLSGDAVFTITRTLNGAVRIMFAPTAAGTYNATLTITSGTVSESISFSATAVKDEEPEIEPIISNLMVPEFGEVLIGETVQRIATYTLENATEATATLSGDAVFTITRSQNGLVRIKFAPTEAGTYNGTLTITSGKVSESINFSAIAIEEGSDNPDTPNNPDTPDNPDTPVDPEDPDTPVVPDPLPEYPVRGYMYVVNTPDAELEKMVKYKPVSIDKVDYFLAPEKTGQKIYGYDIYKFEVRDEEMIDLWEYPNAQYTSWHIDVNVDLSATPYLANGVWYASIEEMMTWYVRYIPQWDDEASEKMIVESPNVYVATFDAFAESDDNDKYYYCLGNVEDPILEVGVSEYGVIQNYLQIPQGFKAMIYLDDTNWETEWKTYYKLVPPGKDWNRDCIDLGLSSGLCWATKNLGATEPQQEGTHFAWGEVEPKEDYSYNTYKWANLLKNNEYIKYVTDDYWGTIVDLRRTLEPTDDAANVALEGKWHMPTQADVEELLRECTTEFGSYYGVNGYFVTGPNGNAIFLPAVGIKEGTDYEESTRGGDYWTSSLYEDNQAYAVTLSFSLTYIDVDDMKRTNGLAIRPVIHRDYVGIEEVEADAIKVYAKDHTIYCEEPFQIYTVTGIEVTHLNGALEGVYIVKTENGNKLISVW